MVCVRVGFHENDGNHENDENDEDNSDSYKQGFECWNSGNHGNHENGENHGNPGCKPRVRFRKTRDLCHPEERPRNCPESGEHFKAAARSHLLVGQTLSTGKTVWKLLH